MNPLEQPIDCNVALRLAVQSRMRPESVAIATPLAPIRKSFPPKAVSAVPYAHRDYKILTFRELDANVNRVAGGLQAAGIEQRDRIVLLVRFGEDFITLVFALLKIGATLVLIDPGMPREHLLASLQAARPDGFVALPRVQLLVKVFASRFSYALKNVTVGRRFGFLPKPTYAQLLSSEHLFQPIATKESDPAAVIFTTGSTGPPKGVMYTHQTFNNQIDQLVEHYGIVAGGIDLACFPLFGLFNAVMGTTTIIPDMNPIRPADVDPTKLLDAIDQWQVNQAFGSPALWRAVGRHCDATNRQCPSLRLVLSAGAPVPPQTLMSIQQMIHPDGKIFTPYGATEALPVASIEAADVLSQTATKTQCGAGTCVGKRFGNIDWKVIKIDDQAIPTIDQAIPLEVGIIGELIVRGPVVSSKYVTRTDHNALNKISDGERFWHRMGDVGYLDNEDRFWYCGRKSHRVNLPDGTTLFTEPCEAIINRHPQVVCSGLVGVTTPDGIIPVLVIETTDPRLGKSKIRTTQLLTELRRLASENEITQRINRFLIYPSRLPTDIRHNAKIFREQLCIWANKQLAKSF